MYRVRISDSRVEAMVNISDVRRYYGQFGLWSGLAPDGSPLLVRDISNEEVYSLDLQLPKRHERFANIEQQRLLILVKCSGWV